MAKERLEIELVTEAKKAIRNLNEYVKATGKAVKAQQTHATASQKAGERVGKLTKLVKSYFVEITAGIMIARKLIKTISSLAKTFVQFKQVNMAFENMAKVAGASSAEILKSMKELSGGTISTMETIQSANRAMILGIPIDKLDEMMGIARASAAATGESVKKMFDDIVVGVGRQSRMILDNLGIIVNAVEANEDYAESMGIVDRELTDTERRQAFLNATLKAGEDMIKKVTRVIGIRAMVPFVGGGNTMLACSNLGIPVFGYDLSDVYKKEFTNKVFSGEPGKYKS